MRAPPIAILVVAVILMSSTLANISLSITNSGIVTSGGLPVGKWFDYIVVIMLENHSINFTYGKSVSPNSWTSTSTTCLGNCTYFDSLANANGVARDYTNSPVNGGSLGDYIAITSGDGSLGSSCNGPPTGACLLNEKSIVDSLENGHLTWKAYMEGCPSACGKSSNGCVNLNSQLDGPNWYMPNHNPFIYYANIQNNASRCGHIVSANSLNSQPTTSAPHCWPIKSINDDLFIKDLNSVVDASNYMFLTPNAIDDLHDCNDVSLGNDYLQQLVPQILGSNLFKMKRAALFITFDEQNCTYSGCPGPIHQIYSIWASNPTRPTTVSNVRSNTPYTHFSQLKTIETNWGLPVLKDEGNSNDMHEFLL